MGGEDIDLSHRRFIVCIDEIQQNFVFGAEFNARYATTVTLSDGTTRAIDGLLLRFEPRGFQPYGASDSHARRRAVTHVFVDRGPADCRGDSDQSRSARPPSRVQAGQ